MLISHLPPSKQHFFTEVMNLKLSFLTDHPAVLNVTLMPDFCDDGIGLNGLILSTKGAIFPLGFGKDAGCGFRVGHLSSKLVDKEKLQATFRSFAENITSKKPGVQLSEAELNALFFDPSKWLKDQFGDSSFGLLALLPFYDPERPSLLENEQILRSFSRIAKGNHFFEFRDISMIQDEQKAAHLGFACDDILFHLHSGAGTFVEEDMMKHWSLMMKHHIAPVDFVNGYEISSALHDELTLNFLSDVIRSMILSVANRSAVFHLFSEWSGLEPIILLDDCHDSFSIEGENVIHQKAVQRYNNAMGLPIALLPSTISGPSFLVSQKTEYPYIFHGVGDGIDGESVSFSDSMIHTNFTKPITRKFYPFEDILNFGLNHNWFDVVATCDPWIVIKNMGKW